MGDGPKTLADAMQAEIDGAAKRTIADAAVHGPAVGFAAAADALDAGASPEVVREALDTPTPGDGASILNLSELRRRKLEREETADAEKYLARLRRAQHMLAALVRKSGRIRITRAELEAVGSGPTRFGVKVQDNGDVIVSWLG